jgi:threonine dehydratase
MSLQTTVAETAAYAAFEEAEALNSREVYEAVMAEALPLNVLEVPEAVGSERREAFYDLVERTPLVRSHYDLKGHRGLMKDETVQPSGAYKIRGSTNAVMRAHENDPDLELLYIASAGNAANAATIVGSQFGVTTHVQGMRSMSRKKASDLKQNGAQVHDKYETLEDAMDSAAWRGQQERATSLHPFDQVEVIAGQATAGFELLADLLDAQERGQLDLLRDPIKLFVPVGGGGLISGVACAVRWAKDQGWLGDSNVQVIGVQMEGCDAMNRAVQKLRQGQEPDNLFRPGEFNKNSDGTAVLKPGKLTLAVVADKEFVQDIVLVSETELGAAMRKSSTRGSRVEPAGALARAGAEAYARTYPAGPRGQAAETLITFQTGGNVSDELYEHFMQLDAAATERQYQQEQAERRSYQERMYALGATGLKSVRQRSGPPPRRGIVLGGTFVRS